MMAAEAIGTGGFMKQLARVLAVWLILAGAAMAQDFGTVIGQAQALIAGGRYDEAVGAARAAYRTAPDAATRVYAARLVASAHFRARRYTLAAIWLRIARQAATSPLDRQAVASDFAGLQSVSPWDVQISLSLAPNSNINNGSQAETVTIWGLPFVLNPDARALAGWEASAGLRLAYTLAESPVARTQIGLAASARDYRLGRSAQSAAPDVKGGDYAFAVFDLFASHSWRAPGASGPATLSLHAGRNWYGGDPYTAFAGLGFSQSWQTVPQSRTTLNFGLERQLAAASGAVAIVGSGEAVWETRLASGDALNLRLGAENTASSDPLADSHADHLGLGYSFGRPVLGAGLSVDLGLERRRWPLSIYDASGRRDMTLAGAVEVALQGVNAYGFAPTIRLEAQRTGSNIALFRRDSLGLRFGLDTRF